MKYESNKVIVDLIKSSSLPQIKKDGILKQNYITYSDLLLVCNSQSDVTDRKSILYYLTKTRPIYSTEVNGEKREKSPEYIKLMTRLRAEAQEKEYRSYLNEFKNSKESPFIMGNTDSIGSYSFLENQLSANSTISFGQATKEVKHQLTTILNILITVGSVGYAVWYWSGSSMGADAPLRLLLSIGIALLVLVAEVVVFGGYLRKVDDARLKERSKTEIREVTETLVFKGGKKTIKDENEATKASTQESAKITGSSKTTGISKQRRKGK